MQFPRLKDICILDTWILWEILFIAADKKDCIFLSEDKNKLISIIIHTLEIGISLYTNKREYWLEKFNESLTTRIGIEIEIEIPNEQFIFHILYFS